MASTEARPESAWPRYPDYRIELVPIRGTARVRVGDTVLAESERAVRLIETDHVERLYIPEDDVRIELLETNDHRTVCPFKGNASYWSLAGRVEDIFWTYRDPFDEVAQVRGLLGVYHEKAGVETEIESRWDDGTTSAVRFPAWGDQEDLLALLDPRRGEGLEAPGYHNRDRNVVEGGQLLGQAIVAAAATVPEQRVTWVSATFARPAKFSSPIALDVEVVKLGRTFSTVRVESHQGGKLIAPATVLLDSGAPDLFTGVEDMPAVAGPEQSEPLDMGVIGRAMRVVDGAYSSDPGRVGPPEIHVWIRFRDDPQERCLRQALLAQATTHWSIAAAMAPQKGLGQSMAHQSLSTGPVAISLAFHDEATLDDWILYSTRSIWAGTGLAQGEGRIWKADGRLLASYSLQAMVRGMLASEADKDPSVAM